MPILIALLVVLILGVLFVIAYLSAVASVRAARSLGHAFNVSAVPHSVKRSLRDSRHYAQLIRKTVQQAPAGPIRDRLTRTIKPVDEWLVNLNRLEQALGKLYRQRNLARDLRRADNEIDQLRRQILTADDAETIFLRDLMKSRQKHAATLRELQSFQNQAELRIRKIASDLGATHAELLLVTARGNFNDKRFQRLDENLQDNLSGLRDMLAAMDEIGYSSSAAAS